MGDRTNGLLKNITEAKQGVIAIVAVAAMSSGGTVALIKYVGVPQEVNAMSEQLSEITIDVNTIESQVRANTQASHIHADVVGVLIEIGIEQASDVRFLTCLRRREQLQQAAGVVDACTQEAREAREGMRSRMREAGM